MSTVGDDVVAVFEVRGEHAVVSGEMGARAGMEGESRELSNSGVVRRRVGRDGPQGLGLARGVGAGGDAVVDGDGDE